MTDKTLLLHFELLKIKRHLFDHDMTSFSFYNHLHHLFKQRTSFSIFYV